MRCSVKVAPRASTERSTSRPTSIKSSIVISWRISATPGDNRPLIEVGRYKCAARLSFDPAFMGAAVRHRAFETWQKAVVNIDNTPGKPRPVRATKSAYNARVSPILCLRPRSTPEDGLHFPRGHRHRPAGSGRAGPHFRSIVGRLYDLK